MDDKLFKKDEHDDAAYSDFVSINPAARHLIDFWEESYLLFSESLIHDVKKVLDEFS